MNKEEILLQALNTYGNFTRVTQEFSDNQLQVIYEAMELVKNNAVLPHVSSSASNGFRPNVYISDDLEDLKRRYTPEQLKKMWNDACPKSSEISGKLIITGTPK